nr:hypothetical protein [Tanacetum cinerariifolium]
MSNFNLPEAINKFVKAHLKNVLPKDVLDFGKIKMEKAAKKSFPKYSSTPFDPTAFTIYDQKDTLFKMMSEARAYDRHLAHKALMETKYAALVTKTKAARYDLKFIEDMIQKLWSLTKVAYDKDAALGISHWGPKCKLFYRSRNAAKSRHKVFSHLQILGVVRLTIDNQFGYGYLKEIVVRRENLKEYSFRETNFFRLHLNDFEDLFLLYVQQNIHNLSGDEIVHLVNALRMFTRSIVIKRGVEDVQLGVESYQKRLKSPNHKLLVMNSHSKNCTPYFIN